MFTDDLLRGVPLVTIPQDFEQNVFVKCISTIASRDLRYSLSWRLTIPAYSICACFHSYPTASRSQKILTIILCLRVYSRIRTI